jgi:hypothetical protein
MGIRVVKTRYEMGTAAAAERFLAINSKNFLLIVRDSVMYCGILRNRGF